MPIILLTALVGYVLAFERLLVWGRWHVRDRPFFRFGAGPEADGAALLEGIRRQEHSGTPMARLLNQALACRNQPPPQREQTMQLAILSRLPEVEARITTIGWVGGILPMLGLLGTVSGMIATFKELAFSATRQILSQGLSEALWTTEMGLLGAVPLLAAHHLLTRLKSRWLNRLELHLALLFRDLPAGESHET